MYRGGHSVRFVKTKGHALADKDYLDKYPELRDDVIGSDKADNIAKDARKTVFDDKLIKLWPHTILSHGYVCPFWEANSFGYFPRPCGHTDFENLASVPTGRHYHASWKVGLTCQAWPPTRDGLSRRTTQNYC